MNNRFLTKSDPDSITMLPPSSRLFKLILLAAMFVSVSLGSEQTYYLRQLIISDTEDRAANLVPGDLSSPVVVQGVPILNEPEFAASVRKYIGLPIATPLLNDLVKAITEYVKQHDRLIGKIQIPNQNVSSGTLRLAVTLAHYNDVHVKGNRWFSSKLLEERLGVRRGEEVRISALDEAINWTNTNPFRQVKVLVNEVNGDPTKADVVVGVRERIPLRVIGSYDDNGTDILGNRHYTAGLQFGNLWGLDHQGSYQFVTTDTLKKYQAHVFDYKVPLAWRHFVELTGSYVRARPVFYNGLFGQDAENISASLRYTIPVRSGVSPIDWFASADFKESNNNLEFGGESILKTKYDTFQLTTGFTAVFRDKRGAWLLGSSVSLSPGYVNSRNNDEAYQNARYASSPRYAYLNVNVQRTLLLEKGWDIFSRAVAQVSNRNLLGNEQLVIGGANTVRGFNTNVFAGDNGFVFSSDLQSPVISRPLPLLQKDADHTLETRFVLFYDVAEVTLHKRFSFDPRMTPLASAGLGLRMSVSNTFSLNFDYGWQISHLPYTHSDHGRGHVKVVLAF